MGFIVYNAFFMLFDLGFAAYDFAAGLWGFGIVMLVLFGVQTWLFSQSLDLYRSEPRRGRLSPVDQFDAQVRHLYTDEEWARIVQMSGVSRGLSD